MPTIRVSEEAYQYLSDLIPKIEKQILEKAGVSITLTIGDVFNEVIQYYREKASVGVNSPEVKKTHE